MNDKKDFYRLSRIKEICENNYFPVYSDFNDEGFQEKIQDIMKRYDVPYLFLEEMRKANGEFYAFIQITLAKMT